MKYLKYLIFIFVLFLTPNVFATSIKSSTYSQKNGFNTSSRYDYTTNNLMGDDYSVVSTGSYGTTYNGKSYYFQFNVHFTLTPATTYDLKISSTTSDFTSQINIDRVVPLCYASFSSSFNEYECSSLDIQVISVIRENISSGQSKSFTIRFRTTNDIAYKTYWGFKIAGGMNNLTGVSNFKVTDIDLKEVNSNDNTDTIINNNNQNTQSIIDNDTNNTNSIINNNNENTETIVDNINQGANTINQALSDMCPNLADWNMTNANKFTLTATHNDTFYESNYKVPLQAGITYYFSYSRSGGTGTRPYEIILSYNNSYAYYLGGYYTDSFSFTPQQTGDYYLRMDCNNQGDTCNFWNFYVGLENQPYCAYGSSSSKLDTTNSIAQDTNNYLKDDSDPNISNNEFTDLFNSVAITNPLDSLLQLPVQFVNAIVNQSNSCQVVNLGTLLGVPISLPCIDIGSILGSSVWDTIDILSSIGLIVLILKQLYESVTNALTLGGYMEAKKGGLGYMTPLDFLCEILTGFGGDRI